MSGLVLTVDDAKAVRQMVRFTLEAQGFSVVEAENGQDALNKLSTCSPKLIVTDLNMPVMNGLEFIKNVRSSGSNPGVPIVMLTTESDPAMKAKGKEAGATGWLNKPFDEAMLVAVAKKLAG